MNGWIVIGAKLDKKQLERDLKQAEADLRIYEREAENLATKKLDIQAKIEFNDAEYERKAQEIKAEFNKAIAGRNELGQEAVKIEYQQRLNQLNAEYDKQNKTIEKDLLLVNRRIENNKIKQDEVNKEVSEMNTKLSSVNKNLNMSNKISGIANGMSGLVKTALRWALAIFGVRSAYNFIRNSISTLSQYNEQIGTDVEYIRFALATTLQPVIERIIQLAYQVLSAIGSIIHAIFGVNIFANATTEAFRKQNKALGGSVKNAKQLQKTLAGFDEMNVLQDDGNVGGGGGGGGIPLPSFELSELKPIDWDKVEKWFDDAEVKVRKGFGIFRKNIGKILKDLGISKAIREDVDMIWSGKEDISAGLIKGVKGVMIIIRGILEGDAETIKRGVKELGNSLLLIIQGVVLEIMGILLLLVDGIKELFIKPVVDLIKQRIEEIKQKFRDIKAKLQPFLNLLAFSFTYTFDSIKRKASENINDFVKGFSDGINKIKNFFSNLPTFITNIINQIGYKLSYFGSHTGEVIGGALKGVLNAVLQRAENVLNSPINAINNLISNINKLPGVNIGRLSRLSLPRLAKGGIINQPGRGVMVGSAIAGESGREGVIPLTDSQQMALLGEAIGRYINISATVPVYVGNRMVAREIKRINAEDDFAYNR